MAAVRREVRRLGRVDRREVDHLLGLAGHHVLQHQRSVLPLADEVRQAIVDPRPGHPRHRVPPRAGELNRLVPEILVEARGQVAHDLAVLGRQQDDVDLPVLPVDGVGGEEVAGRRRLDRVDGQVPRLEGVGGEVAAVVVGPLLVAEGLEPAPDVRLELDVELLVGDVERVLVDVALAADDRLPQGEQELPDPGHAPALLDELEGGVPEVVDQPGARVDAPALEVAHLRQGVRQRGVADRHQVEGAPHAAHVVGQPLVHPQRNAAPDDRARNDVERELVGQLVGDQPVELVRRLVDRQHDALPERLGEGAHAVRHRAGNDVLLLELAVRLEDDEGNEVREVVRQVGADLGVRALGVAGDALEVLLDVGVVEDLEVVGGVDVPLEVVVLDPVLAVVGEELGRGLGHRIGGPAEGQGADQNGADHAAPDGAPASGAAHVSPREGPAACGGSWRRVRLILTVATRWPQRRDRCPFLPVDRS